MGGTPKQPVASDDGEADAIRFLQESGLADARMDPVSFEALKIVMAERNDKDEYANVKPSPEPPRLVEENATVLPQQQQQASSVLDSSTQLQQEAENLKRALMEMTLRGQPPYDQPATDREKTAVCSEPVEKKPAPTVTVAPTPSTVLTEQDKAGLSTVERMMLEQLEVQTQMMMSMHERLDQLTDAVHQLGSNRNVTEGFASRAVPAPAPAPSLLAEEGPKDRHFRIGRVQQRVVRPGVVPQQQQQQQEREQQPPPQPQGMAFFSVMSRVMAYILAIPARIRASRTAKVWELFWVLFRRDIRWNLGPNLKAVVMLAIFATKHMSKKPKRNQAKNGFWTSNNKFLAMMAVVSVGIFIHTGIPQFLYRFFVKEAYPQRIYAGEEVDINSPRRIHPPRGPALAPPGQRGGPQQPGNADGNANNNNNNRRRLRLEQTLLGGAVPQERGDGITAFVTDFAVLLLSFILSILPMWKPIAPPQPRVRMAAAAPQQQQQQQQQQGVAPPPDLDQFAADDDDDNDNDDNDQHGHRGNGQ